MTVDEILARKQKVLEMRRAELAAQERGEGDNFNLFFINEELNDLNAQLRTLRGAPRSVGKATNSQLTMDRAQYQNWLESDRDEEAHAAHKAYIDAVNSSASVLTERQKEIFDLWQNGMRLKDIAARLGVDESTVSRTLTRGKARMRKEAEILAKKLRLESLTVFDLADRDTARLILSCLTNNQAVCIYLYYGEWLNLRDCGELLGVDHTAVLRTVRRGLHAIQDTLRCGEFTLDNVDALSDLAYELYLEQGVPESVDAAPAKKRRRKQWARQLRGYAPSKPKYTKLPICTVRTSDGLIGRSGVYHNSLIRPMSKLLMLLFELRAKHVSLRDWLARLFAGLTKKTGGSNV